MGERKYFLWGTGKLAKQINFEYGDILQDLDILGYIDNNQELWNTQFEGKYVFSPEILNNEKGAYLVIANAFKDEIIEQIKSSLSFDVNRIEENFFEKIQIIARYRNSKNKDEKEIATWLMDNPLQVFNYAFAAKYNNIECQVEYDSQKKLFFTIYEGKKMFLSRQFNSKERAEQYVRWLCMEQDIDSPHRYIKDVGVLQNDLVILDAGAAEGNFSLSLIDKAKKIYIFEPDVDWLEALKYTFAPYNDKVVIINKGLSDYESATITTIDKNIEEDIDILKMDIEGEEYYALQGGNEVIERSHGLKCFITTYHQEFAFEIINHYFEKKNFDIESSKGFMWFPEKKENYRTPILRKGVIRATKHIEEDNLK